MPTSQSAPVAFVATATEQTIGAVLRNTLAVETPAGEPAATVVSSEDEATLTDAIDQAGGDETATCHVTTPTGVDLAVWVGQVSESTLLVGSQFTPHGSEEITTAIEASMDGIAILNEDETYDYLNQAHAEIYGYDSPAAFLGETWPKCYDQTEVTRFETEVMPTLYEAGEWRGEATGQKQNGTQFRQALSLSLSPNDRVICVVRDISERVADKQQLEARTERLEQFSRLITHDLKNPLNVAQGRASLLEDTELTTDKATHLEHLTRSLSRIEELITDAVDYAESTSPLDPADFEVVDPVAIATQAWQSVPTDDADLQTAPLDAVSADPARLQQVFENLFRNAIDHTQSPLTVTVEPLADTEGFAVSDDGSGIPPEDREKIFDVGVTTRADGTGYGLATVEQFVTGHGWEIAVTDSADGGARFEIQY